MRKNHHQMFMLLFSVVLCLMMSSCLSKDDSASTDGGGTGTGGGNSSDQPGSLLFDGNLKYVEIPASAWLTGDFTICLWMKPSSVAGNTIFSMSTNDKYFYLSYDNNELDWKFEDDIDTDITVDGTTTFSTGGTYQVCVSGNHNTTANPSSVAYVNGVSVGSSNADIGDFGSTYTTFTIGRDIAPGHQMADGNKNLPFEGEIDHVMIWTTVLPANAITQLYNGGSGFDPRYAFGNYTITHANNLQLYYLMGNDPNDVISDPGAVLIDQMGNQNATPVDFDAVDYGYNFW